MMIGTPVRRGRVRNRIATPWRITYDQIGISEIICPFCEEIRAPDIAFNLRLPCSFRIVDEPREFMSVLLQFPNVPRRELIQVREVQAERCDPACSGIDIHTAEAAKELTEFPGSPVISSLGIGSCPFLRHTIEDALREKSPSRTRDPGREVKQRG